MNLMKSPLALETKFFVKNILEEGLTFHYNIIGLGQYSIPGPQKKKKKKDNLYQVRHFWLPSKVIPVFSTIDSGTSEYQNPKHKSAAPLLF